jgi:hypothetical protein
MYLPFYIILSMKYMTTNPWSMQKCSLRDNQVLFHMTRQKHTIKIKCKGHPLINVNKKVDFKSLNFNNHHAI